MPALTQTDVGDIVKQFDALYQPTGAGCVATPRKMRVLLDQLQDYTDEVQWARNKHKALGVAAIAAGPGGIAISELLGGGDVDVAQWRSDMANWQYRLGEYQRILDGVSDDQLDTVQGCEEIYALITAPLLSGIHYTIAPGIVLNDEERDRIRSGTGHPEVDIVGEHAGGHSNAKPPDVISPFTLGNQIIVYQDSQKANLKAFLDDLLEGTKNLVTPSEWPWWAKGAIIAGAGVAVGLTGLYVYQFLPKSRAEPKRRRRVAPPDDPTPSAMTSTTDMRTGGFGMGGGVMQNPKDLSSYPSSGHLSAAAERYWKRHGDKLKAGSFFTYGKGAKKTLPILSELGEAGLIDIHKRGGEYIVTGKGKRVKTLTGWVGGE